MKTNHNVKVSAIDKSNIENNERYQLKLSLVALIVSFGFAIFAAFSVMAEEMPKDEKMTAAVYTQQRSGLPEIPAGYTGVGPVVSGSVDYQSLPSKARKFLEKNCDGHAVVKCNKMFTSGEYDVQLADGLEFEFDAKGNVIETDAPDGYSISQPLLKAVVPGKLYNLLIHNGFQQSVEAVHRDRSGYRIDVSDPVFKAVTFDPSGVLTLVVND